MTDLQASTNRVKSLDDHYESSICSNPTSMEDLTSNAVHHKVNIQNLVSQHAQYIDSGNNSDGNNLGNNFSGRTDSDNGDNIDKFATMSPLSPDAAFNLRLRLAQVRADRDSLQLCLKQTHHALKLIQLDHSICLSENDKVKTLVESLQTELAEERAVKISMEETCKNQDIEIENLKRSLENVSRERGDTITSDGPSSFTRARNDSISSSVSNLDEISALKRKLERTELKLDNAERRQNSHLASANAAKSEVKNLRHQLDIMVNKQGEVVSEPLIKQIDNSNENDHITNLESEIQNLKSEKQSLIQAFNNHQANR